MKKLIVLAGLPGSGKSTYIKNNYNKENCYHFDSDETRRKMFGTYLYFPKDMYDIYNTMIDDANKKYDELISQGEDDFIMIMDSTFLDNKRRMHYYNRLRKFDEYELVMFITKDINFNLANNKKRIKDKWVPEDVIFKMVDQYEEPSEEVKKVFKITRIYIPEEA